MDEFELKERIKNGEDLHTEFKEIIPSNEDLAKSIVCFANTDGGQIIIGVSNTGEIIGVENIDETIRKIDDVSFNRCEPPITVVIETVKVGEKTVIVINVPKGEQRPYRTQNGLYYVRSGNRCRQASRQELLRMFQATESIFFDEIEITKASIHDLNLSYFISFMKRYWDITLSEDRLEEIKRTMRNILVISKNEKPTLAGLLFFCDEPQKFIPYAKIVCAFVDDIDLATPPFDKKEFLGNIPQQLEKSMDFMRLYLREEHIPKGLESEIHFEIPEAALREALVNAIAHRDYTISAPIRILIFKDRVEFRSPGKLPNTVTIEGMREGAHHVLRNPTIYNFFIKMGLVTDVGSGVRRIIRLVRESLNKDVELKETEGEFILTIPRKSL